MSINSIKSNRDFRSCYRRGRSTASRQVVLYWRRRKAAEARFGFVVSKKVGGAVQRNRVRRVLREACRLNSHLFPPGIDYVLVARPESLTLGLAQAEQIVLGLLQSVVTAGVRSPFF